MASGSSSSASAVSEHPVGDSPQFERCKRERDRIPNFVAVNFYDQDEAFRVVDRLNGFG